MSLLFDEDYKDLANRGLAYEEDEQNRFFVFLNYPLPTGLYNVDICNVLIVIPINYNQAGNDMFWTYPRLFRKDGKAIPQTHVQTDNRQYNGLEYCRWSRHWNSPNSWRPGKDNIISIQHRIEWAFRHPDTT